MSGFVALGERREFSSLLQNRPSLPNYTHHINTHPQARLGAFETKMAARNTKRSISPVLWKNRGL